jgi:hypothetical protein
MIAAFRVWSFETGSSGGGGKSGLRRAVCRITSGTRTSRCEDGQCNREHTANGWTGKRKLPSEAAAVRVKRCGKSAPGSQ